MRKPISIYENKGADQLRSNCEADQRLCFRNTDSTIPLHSKSKIYSLWSSSVFVKLGLCRTWSETKIVGFLIYRLRYQNIRISKHIDVEYKILEYKTSTLMLKKINIKTLILIIVPEGKPHTETCSCDEPVFIVYDIKFCIKILLYTYPRRLIQGSLKTNSCSLHFLPGS